MRGATVNQIIIELARCHADKREGQLVERHKMRKTFVSQEMKRKDTKTGPCWRRTVTTLRRARSERSDSSRGRGGNEPGIRLRRRDQVPAELDLLRVRGVNRSNGLKDDSVRGRTAVAVVGLTGVRAQVAERDAPDEQREVSELFVALRREREHPLASPPRHGRPGPAHGVAVDDARVTQHHDRHALIGNDVRSARSGRIFFFIRFNEVSKKVSLA